MHLDGFMILGSAIVGLLVGITGAGGGALMTPMLILLFSITPEKAISSDLVAAVFMKPPAALVHMTRKTVNWKLVALMSAGSVPTALLGSYLLKQLSLGQSDVSNIEVALGAALVLGAAALVLRYVLDKRGRTAKSGDIRTLTTRPVPTVLIGMVGGFIVGMTSVGSGSLLIVLLLFLYPTIGAKQLVGTDLCQAVPLTLAAALGALLFGHVDFAVTASIIIGSVPAAILGSLLSSRAPDQFIRPAITFVILLAGLKYLGLTPDPLAWAAGISVVVGLVGSLALNRLWQPEEQPQAELALVGSAGSSASEGVT
ncbi:MAG: sulfite exporter TauE/SafE family protein [Acidimicrobiales bacterium]